MHVSSSYHHDFMHRIANRFCNSNERCCKLYTSRDHSFVTRVSQRLRCEAPPNCDCCVQMQKIRPLQAHPYFKLDCNAGGSLHALSSAAQLSAGSSSGQALQVALERSAPTSSGYGLECLAAPVQDMQAPSISQGLASSPLQKCNVPAHSNGGSTCVNSAKLSTEAARLLSESLQGDSFPFMDLSCVSWLAQLLNNSRLRVRQAVPLCIVQACCAHLL